MKATILKTRVSRMIALAVCLMLALSIGVISAYAAASRINPANIITSEQGAKLYVNLDRNGVPVDLTAEEETELYEYMAPHDENGNIVPPAEGPELSITAE
jgi:hypothetical protein